MTGLEAPEGEHVVALNLYRLCGRDAPQDYEVEVKIDRQVVESRSGTLGKKGETQEVVRFKYPLGIVEQPTAAAGRFTDNGDGTVRDNNTGLIWLKNANCAGKMAWQAAKAWAESLESGDCGLSDGSTAVDWRLPEDAEFCSDPWMGDEDTGRCREVAASDSLIDTSWYDPAIPNASGTGKWGEGDAFVGVQSDTYWSASPSFDESAYYASLRSGYLDGDDLASAN